MSMPSPLEPVERRLTSQQRHFVELLVGQARGDAVEAVRLMGVSQDERVIRAVAARHLNNPAVQAHLDKLAQSHMPPTEILTLLASHARGDMGDFWEIPEDTAQRPYLNLRKASNLGLTHLIRKLKIGKDGTTELELYDAQAAARDLIKIYNMHRQDSTVRHVIEHVVRGMSGDVRDEVLAALGEMVVGSVVGALPPGEDVVDAEITDEDLAALVEEDGDDDE